MSYYFSRAVRTHRQRVWSAHCPPFPLPGVTSRQERASSFPSPPACPSSELALLTSVLLPSNASSAVTETSYLTNSPAYLPLMVSPHKQKKVNTLTSEAEQNIPRPLSTIPSTLTAPSSPTSTCLVNVPAMLNYLRASTGLAAPLLGTAHVPCSLSDGNRSLSLWRPCAVTALPSVACLCEASPLIFRVKNSLLRPRVRAFATVPLTLEFNCWFNHVFSLLDCDFLESKDYFF